MLHHVKYNILLCPFVQVVGWLLFGTNAFPMADKPQQPWSQQSTKILKTNKEHVITISAILLGKQLHKFLEGK